MTNITKKAKKVFLLLLIIQFIFAIVNIVQAETWIDAADKFLATGKDGATGTGSSDAEVMDIINSIYDIIFPLGVVITVIVGGALGIKFMMASAEDKAKIKESMIPYVVGCIVIYGAFGIWKLVITIFSSMS